MESSAGIGTIPLTGKRYKLLQSGKIFECKISSQERYSSAKYPVRKDIPVQDI
jgi:hypothetical protein